MIELRTLGALDLKAADGHPVHSILAQPKRLALLAYLAVHAAGARRDSVVALFWPELERSIAGARLRPRGRGARAAAEVAQRAERDGDLAAATSAARQAVAFGVDDEPALGRLIALLGRSGVRAGALNAFETFRRGL